MPDIQFVVLPKKSSTTEKAELWCISFFTFNIRDHGNKRSVFFNHFKEDFKEFVLIGCLFIHFRYYIPLPISLFTHRKP